MKVAILIPDGVGIRNFVIGRFLHELCRVADASVYHVLSDQVLPHYASKAPGGIEWRPMSPYNPGRVTTALQYSLSYAHMYWADTASMRRALGRKVKGSFLTRTYMKSVKAAGRATAAAGMVDHLDDLHASFVSRSAETDYYRKEFARVRPDVLFCSHQRPSIVAPAVIAARELGIPAASFIFSWDNLSSKGRIVAPFDHYFVWSDYMAEELKRFYPRIEPAKIHVVGTPQFDPYADPAIHWSRDEFFRRVGADPSRKLICFSGGDAGTCPEDPLHVEVIMKMIRSGQIKGNPQLLVRPVPVDDGKRYQRVRDAYPEMIYCQPDWLFTDPGHWSKVIPTAADTQFLANLTAHADMNINLGSTMTLDFGLNGKPVVNTAFDVNDPPLFGMPVYEYYYKYDHFQPVIRFGASRIARSQQQLAEFVNAYLDNPQLDSEGRRKLVEQQVNVPLGQSSRRITEALSHIARRGSAAQEMVLQAAI